MHCDVSAYDDRQKAKRESIISRPLFSLSDKSLSSTPAAVSSSSSSSSSSSAKSAAVQQKLAALSHIRSRSQSTLFRSQSTGSRRKLTNSPRVFGVRRRASDRMPDLEPDTKHWRLSDTLTQDERVNSIRDDEDLNCSNTDASHVEKLGISESWQSESSSADRDDTHHVAGALSLVSKYNSSASSSNDSD